MFYFYLGRFPNKVIVLWWIQYSLVHCHEWMILLITNCLLKHSSVIPRKQIHPLVIKKAMEGNSKVFSFLWSPYFNWLLRVSERIFNAHRLILPRRTDAKPDGFAPRIVSVCCFGLSLICVTNPALGLPSSPEWRSALSSLLLEATPAARCKRAGVVFTVTSNTEIVHWCLVNMSKVFKMNFKMDLHWIFWF